ncbi:glycosyltransferase [Pseudarthrobacter sp. R1]|uniref:glycosyltransferase n=1 Tax=Pseudarthrobacter sp. R1 TaxID=2944934 RepID=UPI00210B5804|nr:glycosyltransferase [Pseudarthrobacter sp. R1]MCQ6271131.1 glycosyltransferase [Pseudarthrobacter sp. R1]
MKIVHLMGALRPSGMERMFLSASIHFRAAGVETIIVGQGSDQPFAQYLTQAGYRVEVVPSVKTYGGAKAWATLLRRLRPDVVHIHTEGAFVVSVLVARASLPGTPIVRTVHSIFRPTGKAKLSRRLQGLAADKFVAAFVAVSPEVCENERSYNRDARTIFNWVDDTYFQAREVRTIQTGKPSAVIVGNSSPIKNQVLALQAVWNSGLDLYFHGDETGATKEEVTILDALEDEGRLRHRGTSDPRTSLLQGSVFLLPSRHEGLGIALAEALVVGLPAIVNNVPGLRWAHDFPNVTVLPIDQDLWNVAVKSVERRPDIEETRANPLPIDLSPARGASEYLDLYTSVSAMRLKA